MEVLCCWCSFLSVLPWADQPPLTSTPPLPHGSPPIPTSWSPTVLPWEPRYPWTWISRWPRSISCLMLFGKVKMKIYKCDCHASCVPPPGVVLRSARAEAREGRKKRRTSIQCPLYSSRVYTHTTIYIHTIQYSWQLDPGPTGDSRSVRDLAVCERTRSKLWDSVINSVLSM